MGSSAGPSKPWRLAEAPIQAERQPGASGTFAQVSASASMQCETTADDVDVL